VNCIAPETILTERNLERIPKEQLASLADTHPLKRLAGHAGACTSLASPGFPRTACHAPPLDWRFPNRRSDSLALPLRFTRETNIH
jgi:hypothetical protein